MSDVHAGARGERVTASMRSLIAVAVAGAIPFLATLVLATRTSPRLQWAERLIPYAVGTMFGAAVLHLIPEALDGGTSGRVALAVTLGIVAFAFLDWVTHLRAVRQPPNERSARAPQLPLFIASDAIHNFVDGMLVATTFLQHPTLGMVTALAVAMHELPRELGTFALCLSAGLTVRRALWLNAATAVLGVLGALLAVVLGTRVVDTGRFMVPFAAGTFLYLAGSIAARDAVRRFAPFGAVRYIAAVLMGFAVAALSRLL